MAQLRRRGVFAEVAIRAMSDSLYERLIDRCWAELSEEVTRLRKFAEHQPFNSDHPDYFTHRAKSCMTWSLGAIRPASRSSSPAWIF